MLNKPLGKCKKLKQLTKAVMKRALGAEMATHLGYEENNRAATKQKPPQWLKRDFGEIESATPRDSGATFEPKIVGRGQTRMA